MRGAKIAGAIGIPLAGAGILGAYYLGKKKELEGGLQVKELDDSMVVEKAFPPEPETTLPKDQRFLKAMADLDALDPQSIEEKVIVDEAKRKLGKVWDMGYEVGKERFASSLRKARIASAIGAHLAAVGMLGAYYLGKKKELEGGLQVKELSESQYKELDDIRAQLAEEDRKTKSLRAEWDAFVRQRRITGESDPHKAKQILDRAWKLGHEQGGRGLNRALNRLEEVVTSLRKAKIAGAIGVPLVGAGMLGAYYFGKKKEFGGELQVKNLDDFKVGIRPMDHFGYDFDKYLDEFDKSWQNGYNAGYFEEKALWDRVRKANASLFNAKKAGVMGAKLAAAGILGAYLLGRTRGPEGRSESKELLAEGLRDAAASLVHRGAKPEFVTMKGFEAGEAASRRKIVPVSFPKKPKKTFMPGMKKFAIGLGLGLGGAGLYEAYRGSEDRPIEMGLNPELEVKGAIKGGRIKRVLEYGNKLGIVPAAAIGYTTAEAANIRGRYSNRKKKIS